MTELTKTMHRVNDERPTRDRALGMPLELAVIVTLGGLVSWAVVVGIEIVSLWLAGR